MAYNPLLDDTVLSSALADLGVTDQVPYEISGEVNYVDEDFLLTRSDNGTMTYRLINTEAAQAQPSSESDAVEKAWLAVSGSIGKYCGDADDTAVCFESASAADSGGYLITFRYVVDGGVVQLGGDGAAAHVTVKDGQITEMELRYRNYAVSEDTRQLLPEIQASAASDGSFMLCYPDDGGDSSKLEPCWILSPLYSSDAGGQQ
jgi:hypothetical protein